MATLTFWRRPIRLILYGLLLALLSAAGLFFCLQYKLDRQALQESADNYAYVGTAHLNEWGSVLEKPLPGEVQELLQESDNVSGIHIQHSRAARILERKVIPETMMYADQLHQRFYAHARIVHAYSISNPEDEIQYDDYVIVLLKQYGREDIGIGRGGASMTLIRTADEPPLENGQELFFHSAYSPRNGAVATNFFSLMTPAAAAHFGLDDTVPEPLAQNPFFLLEEGQGEAEIMAFMEETGIMPHYERYLQVGQNMTVQEIDDFSMLPNAANLHSYVVYGRALGPEDAGKKVCMVSQNLMLRNRFILGDKVKLSISPGCYTAANGWQSGYPGYNDTLLTDYSPGEEYEIVGIFHQLNRDTANPLYYGNNDILIPKGNIAPFTGDISACNLSFRVQGKDFEAFLAEDMPRLEDLGYTVLFQDKGWERVKETYYSMEVRMKLTLACALVTLLCGILAFCILLHNHMKQEYGLQRLLGAYRREALGTHYAGLLTLAPPALSLSAVAAALAWKAVTLAGAVQEAAQELAVTQTAQTAAQKAAQAAEQLAGGEQAGLLLLVLVPLAELGVMALLLPLMAVISEKRGVLRLVK